MDIRLESGRAFSAATICPVRPAVAIVPVVYRAPLLGRAEPDWPPRALRGRAALAHHRRCRRRRARLRLRTKNVPDWIAGTVYVPHGPNATMEDGRVPSDMTLALRTSLSGAQVETLLRRLVAGVSGEVVVGDVRPMSAVLADAVAAPAATTSLLVTMAGLALVLGCIGVYGVLSFLVSRQTRDLGIRVALGAQRSDVFWPVIREGATLCVAGIAIGIAGAMALSRWLSSELHGVSPTDPATYIAVAAMMSIVTLMASYVPTRRAMDVDPLDRVARQLSGARGSPTSNIPLPGQGVFATEHSPAPPPEGAGARK